MSSTTGSSLVGASSSASSLFTQGPSGRERAIEALIDREPQGSFYRAARVIDDAVPIAISSRPNLITKAALIEQAFALAIYDIDTVEKYDEAYSKDFLLNNVGNTTIVDGNPTTTIRLKTLDSLTRERILNYQTKVIGEKLKKLHSREDSTCSVAASGISSVGSLAHIFQIGSGPSAGLVAALRCVFEEPPTPDEGLCDIESAGSSTQSSDLRQFLQAISSHPLFSSSLNNYEGIVCADNSVVSSSTINMRSRCQSNLEHLLLQLQKYSEKESDEFLQGLLVSALSLLTWQQAPSLQGSNGDVKASHSLETPAVVSLSSDTDEVEPLQINLQVGALLALMPLDTPDFETRENDTSPVNVTGFSVDKSFYLDPVLLNYFGEASAVHEERLEIRKARMLARLQTPEPKSKRPGTPPPAVMFSDFQDQNDTSKNSISSVINLLETTRNEDEVDRSDRSVAVLREAFEQLVSAMQNESDFLEVNTDVTNNILSENVGNDGDEDDDDEEDDEDDDDSSEESGEDDSSDTAPQADTGVVRGAEDEVSADEGDQHQQPEQSDDDDVLANDESSSSSSSSDSSSEDRGMIELDRVLDTDEEDDAVLRQALALSIVDQEEKEQSTENATGIPTGSITETNPNSLSQGHGSNFDGNSECGKPNTHKPTSRIATPTKKSFLDDQNSVFEDCNDEDTSNLPPFPKPPTLLMLSYVDSSSTSVCSGSDDPDAVLSSKTVVTQGLDPSDMDRFGTVPNSHVLLHILRYAGQMIERRKSSKASSDVSTNGTVVNRSYFFTSTSKEVDSKSTGISSDIEKSNFTLQLLLSVFFILFERRTMSIENLRNAFSRSVKIAQGGESFSYQDNHNVPSGEEDDPALAFAMNYVEDDAPLSTDILETKGMRRKAAAAAHDNAALLSSLRKQVDIWRRRVKLYSTCVVQSMSLIRNFLQAIVRNELSYNAGKSEVTGVNSVSMFASVLSSVVLSKLETYLSGLSCIQGSLTSNLLSEHDGAGNEDLFHELELYKESILLWAECVPVLHHSSQSQIEVLLALIDQCSNKNPDFSKVCFVTEISMLPTNELETSAHKLQTLCRRLRISDILSKLIPKPIPYTQSSDDGLDATDGLDTADGLDKYTFENNMLTESDTTKKCSRSSWLLSQVGKSLVGLKSAQKAMQQLYLALCHRCHSNILLFDGLYATSETEVDDSLPSTASSKMLSTGDTVRVNSTPSVNLQFDSTKCSDSIAILPGTDSQSTSSANGSSVHQRASKVWGTVLSSHYYSPKTGIHRWAVRLDKCERGHVFIGVATAQASMRTYVGGDKYGWGMIGTQALWHDRRKIRGDYGATFRTGSTIIVALDTDAGTLSFSCWRDSNTSASYSLDPLVQNLLTPRLTGHIGGTVEDWGVAFEGLPLDSRLYPAVGLYQRDDRVTLLTVENSVISPDNAGIFGGLGHPCYYPPRSFLACRHKSCYADHVRAFNDNLTWDGIVYTTEVLTECFLRLRQANDTFLVSHLLPSLAAALCLLPPSVPVLSTRFALILLPHLTKLISKLDEISVDRIPWKNNVPFEFQEGKWSIQTISSGSSSDVEEYNVDFTNQKGNDRYEIVISGKGVGSIGKSKNGLVSIFGCLTGSLLNFVEDWTEDKDESLESASRAELSSCVISARLSLDGKRFEGIYRNIHEGSTGRIVGLLREPSKGSLSFRKIERWQSVKGASTVLCEALLCLAHGHLSSILVDSTPGDLDNSAGFSLDTSNDGHFTSAQRSLATQALSRQCVAKSSLFLDDLAINSEIAVLRKLYQPPVAVDKLHGLPVFELFEKIPTKRNCNVALTRSQNIFDQVSMMDSKLAVQSGGFGSLQSMCPSIYTHARRQVICALLHFMNLKVQVDPTADHYNKLIELWRMALKIMEDGVRNALSRSAGRKNVECCIELCDLYSSISTFLMDLQIENCCLSQTEVFADLSWLYSAITDKAELGVLRSEMLLSSRRGIMRLSSFAETFQLLSKLNDSSTLCIESIVVGLPGLLGRGRATFVPHCKQSLDESPLEFVPELDGNYQSALEGCCATIRNMLKQDVIKIYHYLAQVVDRIVSQQHSLEPSVSHTSNDSLVLVVLAVFVGSIRLEDMDSIVLESNFLAVLSKVFAAHRSSLTFDQDKSKQSTVVCGGSYAIVELCKRDISRAIMKCGIAAAHVIIYQASKSRPQSPVEIRSLSPCLNLLRSELDVAFSIVKNIVTCANNDTESQLRGEEWKRWYDTTKSTTRCPIPDHLEEQTKRLSGVEYLRCHSTLSLSGGQGNIPRFTKSSTMGSVRSNAEGLSSVSGGFTHQHLSHWLHVLSAVLRSSPSLEKMSNDVVWLSLLFDAVGLTVKHDISGQLSELNPYQQTGMLPSRFRSRILRLLPLLLSLTKPSDVIVDGLLQLAGLFASAIPSHCNDDDSAVVREAISLLRYLYSPPFHSWRACVSSKISQIVSTSPEDESVYIKKVGVFSLFSGPIDSLVRGSYVLLKPAAAAALSSDHQPSSSGKSHPGGVGGSAVASPTIGMTPHHVAGNGTEGVITGICRDKALAGIVSNVDLKNAICEVILVARDYLDPRGWKNFVDANCTNSLGSSKSSSGGRHTLTVRALRTPISGLILAQEVPLYLDPCLKAETWIGPPLNKAVTSFLEKTKVCQVSQGKVPNNTKQETEEVHSTDTSRSNSEEINLNEIHTDLMVLRCGIVLLSNSDILNAFLKYDDGQSVFSKILTLAWPSSALTDDPPPVRMSRSKGVASLPTHEVRYKHLVSLARDLHQRVHILKKSNEKEQDRWMQTLRSDQEHFTSSQQPEVSQSITESHDSHGRAPSSGVQRTDVTADNTRELESASNRSISQMTGGSHSEDDEENEATATAAAHLREAAIAQMAELGLPRAWAELALRRTGGINIEAAVTFCLERGAEIERILTEEQERDRLLQRDHNVGPSRRRSGRDGGPSNHLLRQLLEMGFPRRWCTEALSVTGNNVDDALTWILNNGERLSEEDEAIEAEGNAEVDDIDDDDSVDGDEEEDETEAGDFVEKSSLTVTSDLNDSNTKQVCIDSEQVGWRGSITPLRFISGRANVDTKRMEISGLPTGGFSSVGTKGILLTSGKWYYEAILETAGCLQIGWADGSFAGHCHADRGDGCGDGPSSWAYDGWRRYRWHATATEWGCRWREGDVVGCMVDMDDHIVSFTLNGLGESIGMGVAFTREGFRPCGGVYACVSFNRREKLRLILGGQQSESFKFQPPTGYRGVGEAVLEAVQEREILIAKESALQALEVPSIECPKRFLCDFSDGEHGHELMAWAHRYYGSDASVHLGSGRSKHNVVKPTAQTSFDSKSKACVSRRVEKVWKSSRDKFSTWMDLKPDTILQGMESGYKEVELALNSDIQNEAIIVSILLVRKVLLHSLITLGHDFIPSFLKSGDEVEAVGALRLWKILEVCTSLRNAGWVGEAGAMALAAEALGLGISSNEHMHSRSNGDRSGIVSAGDLDEGVFLPTCGFSQLLTSVVRINSTFQDTSYLPSACAEASMGGEGGGGILAFLKEGLQSACIRSSCFRDVLLASVRRSVRLLAAVEYDGDDFEGTGTQGDDEDDVTSKNDVTRPPVKPKNERGSESYVDSVPDARLASYITGLLLSKPVIDNVCDNDHLIVDIFQAWSVGLLSATLPWRMVCAFTAAGVMNLKPKVLFDTLCSLPTLARLFGRLRSTIARRLWAERAASPVCSRYIQAMIELLSSTERAIIHNERPVPSDFSNLWNKIQVDAATPLPFGRNLHLSSGLDSHWESINGWISGDSGWEVWSGSVKYKAVDWKTPSRSSVRTLMDGGDGPPMLREGCLVVRGIDWDQFHNEAETKNDDGKEIYDAEKLKREKEKQKHDVSERSSLQVVDMNDIEKDKHSDPAKDCEIENASGENETSKTKKKRGKVQNPKLPLGTVISIEDWKGIPCMARRVRWHLTNTEGVYRYGGDGGRFDLCHVEANGKHTRIKKRHPLPESREQCSSRHGFGVNKQYNVMLRLRRQSEAQRSSDSDIKQQGILEWPDFGAGIRVNCTFHRDGGLTIEEIELLFGSKDSGWEPRFGQPSYIPGSLIVLSPTNMSVKDNLGDLDIKSSYLSQYEELIGSCTFNVDYLRNPENGSTIQVTSEMKIYRGRSYSKYFSLPYGNPPLPPPLTFDKEYHAHSLSLSKDGRTISCLSSDCRGTAFASMGFTKGVHYWEVKLEQADIGSVFVGVAEKPIGSGSGSSFVYDTPPKLNRWHGWGFVNFRATFTSGAERVYGSHCHAGDTVGVLLDCDTGRVSFFFDGLKYGEHILNDLGCAFENLSPFGFNVDGCGSGGAGQGAPSGFENGASGRFPAQGTIRPRTLWPVVGLRNLGDRVTISSKWHTSYGIDGAICLENIRAVDSILNSYFDNSDGGAKIAKVPSFPDWFIQESFMEYRRWKEGHSIRTVSRGSGPYRLASFGLDLELDSSPLACASACASLGLDFVLLSGDRVRLKRSAGRILELAEEALVLGAFQGRLYYRIVSQKSEGGSLTEGGGRAWCWDESEVVDGLPLVSPDRTFGVTLPKLSRFKCMTPGGLRVVYENGAVVRSDVEIFDGSTNLGTIPVGKTIPKTDVLERRVNSCGVVRFRVRYDGIGEGWISSRIRGGTEEFIVESIQSNDLGNDFSLTEDNAFLTPIDCATAWYEEWSKKSNQPKIDELELDINNVEDFTTLMRQGLVEEVSAIESDSILSSITTVVGNQSGDGDTMECTFRQVASALSYALASHSRERITMLSGSSATLNQGVLSLFANIKGKLPSLNATMARIAVLRAFNRRIRYALPWLSIRPCQEGSALFGGVSGHGASVDRAGRTRLVDLEQDWVQVPSIASRIRILRGLIFTSIKMEVLHSISDATTTPTPLSNDEYELPREIRTVRINRLKAGRAMMSDDPVAKRKYAVFSQLHNETKNWGGASLRRGYVAKGHGGQKRAFKVKLIGEGVNDYSGPYREVFMDALSELLKVDSHGMGVLGVLDPTPNNRASLGENRDLFMFSFNGREPQMLSNTLSLRSKNESQAVKCFASLMMVRDEASREVEESLVFLGKLAGTAFRHRIPLDLPLPLCSVWKALTEEAISAAEKLYELDFLAHRQLESLTDAEESPIVWWQQRMLNSFAEGLGNVLPVEILPLFTGHELCLAICGNKEVDVYLLKQVVEYEGYEASDKVITYFWDTLLDMTSQDRKKFLQFVWARNRLPVRVSDFESPFKIQRDSLNSEGKSDQALPSASTCFFSLTLPDYSSASILKDKLLFAINNVTTMETDFQTNAAEIAEGYRAF